MAIDLEPKNGDFARYIENLTNAGGITPGRVPDKREAARQAASPAAVPVPAPTSEPLSTAPWGKPAPPPLQSRRDAASLAPRRRSRMMKARCRWPGRLGNAR